EDSSCGGTGSMPMHPGFLSRAQSSPRQAASRRLRSESECRFGGRARRRNRRRMVPRAGRPPRKSGRRGSFVRMVWCSAALAASIYVTTGRSMCCASRPPGPARALAVIPTLLTWPGSAIVHDIKGENWQLTAGWRARFARVLLFDPTNAESSAYNPLLEVRRGDAEVRDVQNVADILVDPEGALERRNHWEKTSHSLLVGAILHVLYAEADKTLAGVANFLSD